MRYYWQLQCKMLNRHLIDFGLPPVLAYLLAVPVFIGLSVLLFSRVPHAGFIYDLIAISYIQQLSETNRNNFLKTAFTRSKYYKIRLTENILAACPFLLLLIYKQAFLPATLLLLAAAFLVLIQFNLRFNFSLPTPFYKKPFEFIVGFRNTFYVFLITYLLTGIAIAVGNFNLGIFSLLVVFLTCFSFYTNPDSPFYVWVHAFSSKAFLRYKIKIAILFSTLLSLPVAIGLGIFFIRQIPIVLAFQGLGYLYLITIILARYAVFPNAIQVVHILLIGFSMLFPPALLGVIPYFYLQAIKKLNGILE